MGNRTELPSGGWVELIDLDSVRGTHRKRVQSFPSFVEAANAGNALNASLALYPGVAHVVIERYSIPYAPFDGAARVNMIEEDWDGLIIPDQDALIKIIDPFRALLFATPPSPDDMRPGSPTPPAGE